MGHRRDIKYQAEGYTPKIALADAIFELKFKCVYFTVSLAAQQLGISQQEAEQILSEFYTRRLRQGRINIPVSRHRAHSHTVRKRTGGYKTPPVGAIPTGGDPFLDTELPQMILEHHAEAAPFM